jgi:hypothetical protein
MSARNVCGGNMSDDDFDLKPVSMVSPLMLSTMMRQPMGVDPSIAARVAALPEGGVNLSGTKFAMPTADIGADGVVRRDGGTPSDKLDAMTKQITDYTKSKQHTELVRDMEHTGSVLGVDVSELAYSMLNPGMANPAAMVAQAHLLNMKMTGVATVTSTTVKSTNKLASAAQ